MTCDSHVHPHCMEMFAKLSEYIDQEIDKTQRLEIEAHVAECVACFSCLLSLKQTIALCKQTGSQPVPQVFSQKLQTMVQHIQRLP